jgi:hypothetical protein
VSIRVAMVLGFAMQYQIAEVVDPRFNVVAKIKKNALVGLKSPGANSQF